jgi:hypothetical protein
MKHVTIAVVEEMLQGKISNNPNRFEAANGVMFAVNKMTEEVASYFSAMGVEYHELVKDIFYTETVMSTAEFSQLDYVMNIKHLA